MDLSTSLNALSLGPVSSSSSAEECLEPIPQQPPGLSELGAWLWEMDNAEHRFEALDAEARARSSRWNTSCSQMEADSSIQTSFQYLGVTKALIEPMTRVFEGFIGMAEIGIGYSGQYVVDESTGLASYEIQATLQPKTAWDERTIEFISEGTKLAVGGASIEKVGLASIKITWCKGSQQQTYVLAEGGGEDSGS